MVDRRSKLGSDYEPVIPVTPVLDLAFQLLAFFVITFKPTLVEGKMDLNLPSEAEAKSADPLDVDPEQKPDTDVKLESELKIVVKTVRDGINDGAIAAIELEALEGRTPVTESELAAKLKDIRKSLSNQDDAKIQGDAKLKWACIVQIMDNCLDAGFQRVSFVPPPDLVDVRPGQ
ncbi:MAG: ExbD/TolR family protein [Gemmataceae bacterium]